MEENKTAEDRVNEGLEAMGISKEDFMVHGEAIKLLVTTYFSAHNLSPQICLAIMKLIQAGIINMCFVEKLEKEEGIEPGHREPFDDHPELD